MPVGQRHLYASASAIPGPAVCMAGRKGEVHMEHEVREKILRTAKEIFQQEGYKGTTINSIAKRAGISPSTIYLYFQGKKDLFQQLNISEDQALQDVYNANRASILQTALILFGEHGYDGVSMDMIARESGYSKASLYQYFKDKESLYSAVMQETPFHFNFLSIQPEMGDFDLEAAVKRIGLDYLSIFNTPERTAFTRAIIRDSNRHPEISNMYHKNGIGYVARCLETVLKQYADQTRLRDGLDLYLAAKTYVGSLFGFAIQYKIVVGIQPQYTDEQIVDTLTGIFLNGILK